MMIVLLYILYYVIQVLLFRLFMYLVIKKVKVDFGLIFCKYFLVVLVEFEGFMIFMIKVILGDFVSFWFCCKFNFGLMMYICYFGIDKGVRGLVLIYFVWEFFYLFVFFCIVIWRCLGFI